MTGLHDLFEAAEVVAQLLGGFLAKEQSGYSAQRPSWRFVAQLDVNLSSAVAGSPHESHRAGVLYRGAGQRAPR
ncbi:MAG TPA: hypothetical protein VF442_09770, partial [Sphingobium sp.]